MAAAEVDGFSYGKRRRVCKPAWVASFFLFIFGIRAFVEPAAILLFLLLHLTGMLSVARITTHSFFSLSGKYSVAERLEHRSSFYRKFLRPQVVRVPSRHS